MTHGQLPNEPHAERAARLAIARFASRFGQAHLDLACHAAFPLVLSAELAHALWANFQLDRQGRALDAPWVAVADLLLSGLCQEIGHDPDEENLFEMALPVRQALLRRLREDTRFGLERLRELASFVLEYTEQRYLAGQPDDLVQGQRFTALAYVSPQFVAGELARRLSRLVNTSGEGAANAQADLRYLDGIVETLKEPLGTAHADLARYTRGVRLYADGDITGAAALLDPFLKDGHAKVGGLELAVPTIPSPRPHLKPSERSALPTSSELRVRLGDLLKTSQDFRAFCVDYFPNIARMMPTDMDLQAAANLLLLREDRTKIARALDNFEDHAKAYPNRSPTELRKRLAKLLPSLADFHSFCMDNFPHEYSLISSGMSLEECTNILLSRIPEQTIWKAIARLSKSVANPDPMSISTLRDRLRNLLRSDGEFDGFFLDYFPSTYELVTRKMDRLSKENLLLSREQSETIELKLSIIEGEKTISRSELRRLLDKEFRGHDDFMAFCIDHFPSVSRQFSAAMTRVQLTSLLLSNVANQDIINALRQRTPYKSRLSQELRIRLNILSVTDADFDAFCLDHFRSTFQKFTIGMDRLAKINLLLMSEDPKDIDHVLKDLEPERQAISRTVVVSKSSPLHIILAVDDSGSMRGKRAELTMRAIREFVLELQLQISGVSDKIFISMIIFGSNAEIIAENVDLVSLDIKSDFIPIHGRHGGTNLAPPLRLARQIIDRTRFSSSDPPPWIYIFTDGSAQDPVEALQEATSLKRLPLPGNPPRIAVIAIADQVDIELYQKLATTSEHYISLSDLGALTRLLPEFGP